MRRRAGWSLGCGAGPVPRARRRSRGGPLVEADRHAARAFASFLGRHGKDHLASAGTILLVYVVRVNGYYLSREAGPSAPCWAPEAQCGYTLWRAGGRPRRVGCLVAWSSVATACAVVPLITTIRWARSSVGARRLSWRALRPGCRGPARRRCVRRALHTWWRRPGSPRRSPGCRRGL